MLGNYSQLPSDIIICNALVFLFYCLLITTFSARIKALRLLSIMNKVANGCIT